MAADASGTNGKGSGTGNNARQGVADYFAILGVGEDLVWRHAQQKEQQQQQQSHEEPAHDESASSPERDGASVLGGQLKPQAPEIPEEDDAMLLERFYREIVACEIVLEDDDDNGNSNITTNANANANESAYSNAHDHAHAHSHAITSIETGAENSATNTSTMSAAVADGWTVVRATRPAATDSHPSDGRGKDPRTPPLPSLWKKGATWETNLDPIDGLTGEILRTRHQRDADYRAELERTRSGRGAADAKTPLKHFRKKVQSTFQSKTQQWILPSASMGSGSHNHSEASFLHHPPKRKRGFYLAYKRRSPDEPNLAAIADLALYYVRIHKATIVAAEAFTGHHVAGDGANDDATTGGNTTATVSTAATRTTQQVAAVASAVGRTGIRASAALFHAGKQAVSGRWNAHGSGNPPADDPRSTAGASAGLGAGIGGPPPSVEGGVRPDPDEYQEGGERRGPLIALRSFLELPDHNGRGFEEWVIPETYSCLRFPKRKRSLNPPGEEASETGTEAHPKDDASDHNGYHDQYRRPIQTITALFPEGNESNHPASSGTDQGVEAVDRTPDRRRRGKQASSSVVSSSSNTTLRYNDREIDAWKERLLPRIVDPTDKDLLGIVGGDQAASDSDRYYRARGENVIVSGGSASFDEYSEYNYNYHSTNPDRDDYVYVPVLAIRRQRVGEEERFSEDPALIDISVTVFDERGRPVLPSEEYQFMTEEEMMEDENDDAEKIERKLLHKTKWVETRARGTRSPTTGPNEPKRSRRKDPGSAARVGAACLIARHNVPMGFCDAAFSTRVLDRFPYKNYKGLPLPEEELPMFCYPTGCKLYRARFSDAPLPQYYGFVVKNERGDSIYVSCVSFMEPLTNRKKEQLSRLSEKRRRVSLPHKIYWARKQQRILRRQKREQPRDGTASTAGGDQLSAVSVASPSDWIAVNERDDHWDEEENYLLTAFDQMTTYENKTICLVSRYPYWTAFRRFLSHLHSVSGCSSSLPLERYISHLLLSVPVPKPGGPNILIPLPTFNVPMMISSPPRKDLPLVDLPFERLFACLDVPTIVTMVIGFLTLERKVIVMSKRPSLVLDVCECARALLFPFELVAPYVPRLTEPFMSCLEFPGAIFAGIHDDGTPDGLAAIVRGQMPEDSTIIDLDSGNVDCSGDRMAILNNSWGVLPPGPRSVLVTEIETLCRDASIVPGQEPLDGVLDPSFAASAPTSMVQDDLILSNEDKEPLDDRAVRDAFLRFFCSILVGYERFLVVPDVDFLISGNEWFDAKGFLDAASEDKAVFLGSLVSTQLFQSFIQRRTEASDVHLLLFDECLQEYHSSPVPYGRLGGDVETVVSKETGKSHMLYSLLVDQAAEEARSAVSVVRSFDGDSGVQGSDADNSSGYNVNKSVATEVAESLVKYSEFGINPIGDWVTLPSRQDIPKDACFTYCVDGNPTFPDKLNQCFYVPRQPESWLVEMSTSSTPMLTRSGPEKDEAERRRRFSTSYRGLHSQRRCLWQLPKLMGSHFLGSWLLCIPTLVSQPNISNERQSRHLLRAFGALRLLRSRQKIIPDEAAYRALIVACGRTKNDRRAELVKLFGHLRSDGIFPSAVTLGQYTRALAEGYSKRAVGIADDDTHVGGFEMTESTCGDLPLGPRKNCEAILNSLDESLATLEESGRRWRQKTNSNKNNDTIIENPSSLDLKASDRPRSRNNSKYWLPVLLSSSFIEAKVDESVRKGISNNVGDVQLTAIWSRTVACKECGYIPFEEEVQGGWDTIQGGEHDFPGAVSCARCGFLLTPKLAYKNISLHEAIQHPQNTEGLPPQIRPTIDENDDDVSLVPYICPSSLREKLEQVVDEHGEQILDREKLRKNYPDIFYNFWWYCARFQLPLPLAVSANDGGDSRHCCAIVSWDRQVAMRGCYSAAKILLDALPSEDGQAPGSGESIESIDDFPLLSKFNLSGYYSNVWDHPELSEILVALVQACDKRDFRPVVESVLRRRGDIDCYRTILYLAKYQCTSAFHAFFPATLKPCKGYHFWCPMVPLPIFDRLFREAVKRVRANNTGIPPIHEVQEVPLAFRSVFGHLM